MASGARWGLIPLLPSTYPSLSIDGKMASGARWGLIPEWKLNGSFYFNPWQNGQWSPLGIDTRDEKHVDGSATTAKWPVEPVGD